MVTAQQIWADIYSGAKKSLGNPCSICLNSRDKPKRHFHGSDWGKCTRMVEYLLTHGDTSDSNRSGKDALFLSDGHLHEASIVEALRKMGYEITHREGDTGAELIVNDVVELEPVYQRKLGKQSVTVQTCVHTDGVINGDTLLECKAVKRTSFTKNFLAGTVPPAYYGQVQAYLHAHNLNQGILVAKHRESSEIAPPMLIPKNPEFIKNKLNSLANIIVSIELSKLVPRDHATKNNFECKYCVFSDRCWSEDQQTKFGEESN